MVGSSVTGWRASVIFPAEYLHRLCKNNVRHGYESIMRSRRQKAPMKRVVDTWALLCDFFDYEQWIDCSYPDP